MTAAPSLTVRSGPLAKQTARTDLKPAPPARFVAWSVVLLAGYVLLDAASSMFWIDPVPVKPWNPQAGVAVAFIYAGGVRYAAPLFVAAWICEALFRHPSTPVLQASAALAMTIAFTLAGLAVRWRTLARGLTSVATVRDFLLIAAAGAALSSVLYVATYAVATQQPVFGALYDSILHKGLGDFAGIIAVMPIVVLLLTPRAETMQVREGLVLDAAAFLLTLAAVIGLVFSVPAQTGERLLYLLFVPLILLAMRRGFAGAAFGIATVQILIVTSLWIGGRGVEDATAYQMLMAVLAITALILGAVAAERRLAIAELARRSAELRAQQQALTDAMRNSAASETAATLAHEMSQPLSAIGTYAHAMLEMQRHGKATSGELTAVMERIVAESVRTRETMQRIRDFFRAGATRRDAVDLAAIVADMADALRDRMRAGGICAHRRRAAGPSRALRRRGPDRHRAAQPRRQCCRCCCRHTPAALDPHRGARARRVCRGRDRRQRSRHRPLGAGRAVRAARDDETRGNGPRAADLPHVDPRARRTARAGLPASHHVPLHTAHLWKPSPVTPP